MNQQQRLAELPLWKRAWFYLAVSTRTGLALGIVAVVGIGFLIARFVSREGTLYSGECAPRYRAAHSAADSAQVDIYRPFAPNAKSRSLLTCGELRAPK